MGAATEMVEATDSPREAAERLEIYKLLAEMADRVSQRRQASNNFYLSVNTAIVAATAYLGSSLGPRGPTVVVSIAGIAICVAWAWSIQTYRTLSQAKYQVLHEVEGRLALQPFTDEWRVLTEGERRHLSFHRVEVVAPWVFGAVHAVQLLAPVASMAIRTGLRT